MTPWRRLRSGHSSCILRRMWSMRSEMHTGFRAYSRRLLTTIPFLLNSDDFVFDNEMLAQPLIDALQDIPEPFVLDFATGTGRLSYALMSRTEFKGRIVALDLSQGMLEQAVSKLRLYLSRFEMLRHVSLPLPFPDASFDVVCALEVLELFPNMDEPLAEFSRILRPGGTLVILGLHYDNVCLPGMDLLAKEIRIVPSMTYADYAGVRDIDAQRHQVRLEVTAQARGQLSVLAASQPEGIRGFVRIYEELLVSAVLGLCTSSPRKSSMRVDWAENKVTCTWIDTNDGEVSGSSRTQ